MSAIFFLIGCSVLMALIFLVAFFWANKTGQHEDTYTPSVRILFDDELRQGDVSHSRREDGTWSAVSDGDRDGNQDAGLDADSDADPNQETK